MKEDEIWKIIDNTTEYYISNKGNVKRIKKDLTKSNKKRYYNIIKERILKHDTSVNGYHTVHIPLLDGSTKHFRVHRLVAKYFIPNPNNLPDVNHKDGNKNNNDVSNLEWCTAKYNIKHAINIGLWDSKYEIGEKNSNSKLTEAQVLEIPSLISNGLSSSQIADRFGVSKTAINLIKRGKNWKYLNLFNN